MTRTNQTLAVVMLVMLLGSISSCSENVAPPDSPSIPSSRITADINFGSVPIGRSKDTLFALTNASNDSMVITSVLSTSDAFVIQASLPILIAPHASVLLPMQFTPSEIRPYNEQLTLFTNRDTLRLPMQSMVGAFEHHIGDTYVYDVIDSGVNVKHSVRTYRVVAVTPSKVDGETSVQFSIEGSSIKENYQFKSNGDVGVHVSMPLGVSTIDTWMTYPFIGIAKSTFDTSFSEHDAFGSTNASCSIKTEHRTSERVMVGEQYVRAAATFTACWYNIYNTGVSKGSGSGVSGNWTSYDTYAPQLGFYTSIKRTDTAANNGPEVHFTRTMKLMSYELK